MSRNVLVVGAGTMGAGIAQVCAQAGFSVVLADESSEQLDRATASIGRSAGKLAEKGRIDMTREEVVGAIRVLPGPLEDAHLPSPPEVAIEAALEDKDLKLRILGTMERLCSNATLLATNTSGIPVSSLAEALDRPERFVGLHFFNPVVMMRVVEVVQGSSTGEAELERATELARDLGKEPVVVRKDIPGFVLNRIAMVASNEAIRLVQEGVASAAEIDRGVKGAFGWRMGPLETADLVGLDVVLAARSAIFEQTGDERFEPPALLLELVGQGQLGRKSGRGFHDYTE